jgi:predicted amidohydrolase YtcJ
VERKLCHRQDGPARSVEAGKLADFVVLDGNPLESLANVRRVHRVVKGGGVYDPRELLKPLEGTVE